MQQFLSVSELRSALLPSLGLGVLRVEEAVWRSMVGSWAQQQRARHLATQTIQTRVALIERFQTFTEKYPWQWQASDLDEFSDSYRQRGRGPATVRAVHGGIRVFCDYLTSPDYDWVEICEQQFGETPSQVCLPWNTAAHVQEYEGSPHRRALTFDEVQQLFDYADSRVEAVACSGRKGALGALRDAQMFKTAYAFGLRRAELRGLDLADLHYNARVPKWGKYAALHVRFAKASRGSNPRRRTVLLVPEMAWWIEGMSQWVEDARDRFGSRDLAAMWVTERNTRVSAKYIDARFTALREGAGLEPALTLHCLRHSYVTHLIEYGYADKFVQEQVGHLHASTTSIYTSVSGDFKNRVLAEALARFRQMEDQL